MLAAARPAAVVEGREDRRQREQPAPRSVNGTPTFTGGRPGSPVTDISPDTPCAIRSKPPLLASGPVWPYPEIDA